MISQQASTKEINEYLKESGFLSLYQNANKKIAQGITTKEEIFRVLGNSDETL